MALTAAQRRARDKAEKILLEQQRGSSLFANNQSFPGDFGDGGAVGENITPAPRTELSDLEKESADATAAIESAMAAGDAAAKAGDEDARRELDKLESTAGAKTDSWVFWTTLYMTPVIWAFFVFGQILSFHFFWMITASICFTLSLTNAQGFYYCQRDHKAKLTEYIQ